jgi:hypothetical protein
MLKKFIDCKINDFLFRISQMQRLNVNKSIALVKGKIKVPLPLGDTDLRRYDGKD